MKLRNYLIAVLVLAVAVFVVMGIVKSHNRKCDAMEIHVVQAGSNTMLSENGVRQMIEKSPANPLGRPTRNINRCDIEEVLKHNHWFNSIEEFTVSGSVLKMTVSTKSPIAEVFPENSEPYLLGDNGDLLPDDTPCQDLVVISGHITTGYSPGKNVLQNLNDTALWNAYQVAHYLQNSPDDKAQFPQVMVRPDGQIELFSNLGHHTVLLGDASNLPEKFSNIASAYSSILCIGTENYSSLDARFTNRIYAHKTAKNQ